jgi:hypothetical protein
VFDLRIASWPVPIALCAAVGNWPVPVGVIADIVSKPQQRASRAPPAPGPVSST